MRVLFVTVVNVVSLRNINCRNVFQFQLSRQPSIRTVTMLNDTTNIANADIRCPSFFFPFRGVYWVIRYNQSISPPKVNCRNRMHITSEVNWNTSLLFCIRVERAENDVLFLLRKYTNHSKVLIYGQQNHHYFRWRTEHFQYLWEKQWFK